MGRSLYNMMRRIDQANANRRIRQQYNIQGFELIAANEDFKAYREEHFFCFLPDIYDYILWRRSHPGRTLQNTDLKIIKKQIKERKTGSDDTQLAFQCMDELIRLRNSANPALLVKLSQVDFDLYKFWRKRCPDADPIDFFK